MPDLDRLARRRVKIRLDTDGYADEDAAAEDAARIAAFVAVPAAAAAHAKEHVARLDEVDPDSPLPHPPLQKYASTPHEVLLVLALLIGFGAVALTLPAPTTGRAGARLDPGLLWSGILALASLGIYVGLEPYRRSSRIHSLRAATSGMLLFLAIAWAFVCVISIAAWGEVPSFSIAAPVGMGLLVLAIVGAVGMWLRARRTDRLLDAQAADAAVAA